MKKNHRSMSAFLPVLLWAALVVAALPAAAAVYTVPGDFASLHAARSVAGAGDTVVLLDAGPETAIPGGPASFRILRGAPSGDGIAAAPLPAYLCTDGLVTGTVTDANGAGIGSAQVRFSNEATAVYTSVLTAPAGDYSVCLPAGNYGASFSLNGYLPTVYNGKQWGCGDTVTATAGETVANIDGVLAAGGTISGTVTSDGVTPLVGVQVIAAGMDVNLVKTAFTGPLGGYDLQGLPTGSYRIRFYGTNATETNGTEYYNDRSMESEGDPVAVTAGSTAGGIDAVMPLAGSISGTVDNGTVGIAFVTVEADHPDGSYARSAVTDAFGNYQIIGLRTGSYLIHFAGRSAGYLNQWRGGSVAVTAPGDTGGIDATLVPGGSISGVVSSNGADMGNIDAYAFDAMGEFVGNAGADAAGNYIFRGLPTGNYRLLFWGEHAGYGNVWHQSEQNLAGARTVAVTAPGDTANTNTQISPFTPGNLSGRVTFTGASCGNTRMRIFPPDAIDDGWWIHSTQVGPSGVWRSNDLAPGPWRVQAFADPRDPLLSRWYGGTPSPGFSKVARVAAGQNRAGINFKVPTRGTLPEARIEVGEEDNFAFMGPGEKQPLLLSLDCNGAKGLPVDWWLLAFTPLPAPRNIYHLEPGRGWVEGMAVSRQGPCGDLDAYKVLNLPFVPLDGDADIYFGVDGDMNGLLDGPSLFYDGVRVHMYR